MNLARAGVTVIGDLMLARGVHRRLADDSLQNMLSEVHAAAAGRPIIANLESPLFDGADPAMNGKVLFRASSARAEDLVRSGVHAVSLANNHIMDCGPAGLSSTLLAARNAGLATTGAGLTRQAAMEPAIIDVAGRRFGFLGFSYKCPAGEGAGVAYMYDETVDEAIRLTRDRVDVLIVLPHGGVELFRYPLPRDQELYRRMLELGADMVVGSHPHCVQSSERYHGRMIYYGIGDCLFDHHDDAVWERFWSDRAHARVFGLSTPRCATLRSLLLHVDLASDGTVSTHCVPIKSDPIPRVLQGAEGREALLELERLSAELAEDGGVTAERASIQAALFASLSGSKN